MDINDKLLADLAEQLGFGSAAVSKADRMSDLADKYKGKKRSGADQRNFKSKAQYEKGPGPI